MQSSQQGLFPPCLALYLLEQWKDDVPVLGGLLATKLVFFLLLAHSGKFSNRNWDKAWFESHSPHICNIWPCFSMGGFTVLCMQLTGLNALGWVMENLDK